MTSYIKKQKLFIFEKKEMITFSILAFLIGLFAFTMGIHIGKKVKNSFENQVQKNNPEHLTIPLQSDIVPGRHEFLEQGTNASAILNETLFENLHHIVKEKGIQLELKRQVDLPEKVASKNSGATSLVHKNNKLDKINERYLLQIGSYPSLEEAQEKIKHLNKIEYSSFIEKINLKNGTKSFRIFLGDFETISMAEDFGKKLKVQKKITSFLAIKKK